jgi:mannan endo-1,4-beta-mannosidase
MDAYMQFYNLPTGKNNLAWYKSEACQKQYQKYIKAVVTRYANSNAIFAWELANEPRCNGCDTKVVTEWAQKTSKYIKSLDKNHLVTLGDEGFGLPGDKSYPYSLAEGVNFVENLKIKDLDFGTLHLYPESCTSPV